MVTPSLPLRPPTLTPAPPYPGFSPAQSRSEPSQSRFKAISATFQGHFSDVSETFQGRFRAVSALLPNRLWLDFPETSVLIPSCLSHLAAPALTYPRGAAARTRRARTCCPSAALTGPGGVREIAPPWCCFKAFGGKRRDRPGQVGTDEGKTAF